MKKAFLTVSVLAAAVALADNPAVSGVHLAKATGGGYEITYALENGPAVVTLDIETRADAESAWTSVGSSFGRATGDVSRVVSASEGFIAWFPSESFGTKDLRRVQLRAKVVAWPLDNPPDYMVVSLVADDPQRCTYYEREDLLPHGGVLSNMMYRTTHLPMRKILAKDITWTMGSTNEVVGVSGSTVLQVNANAVPHAVTLEDNYYIGVFEMSQAQCRTVGKSPNVKWGVEGQMRPVDGGYSYNNLRGTTSETTDTPDPTEGSVIGAFRSRTGIDFDLPTEAQWEFACRAGHGHAFWPDGTPMVIYRWSGNDSGDPDSMTAAYRVPAIQVFDRYIYNGGAKPKKAGGGIQLDTYATSVGPTNATAIAGSFIPNDWGLYDMCGNMTEWCRDWYVSDITALNGALVADKGGSNSRVIRGGAYRTPATDSRPGYRTASAPSAEYVDYGWTVAGFRLMAPCIAK